MINCQPAAQARNLAFRGLVTLEQPPEAKMPTDGLEPERRKKYSALQKLAYHFKGDSIEIANSRFIHKRKPPYENSIQPLPLVLPFFNRFISASRSRIRRRARKSDEYRGPFHDKWDRWQ